MAAPNPLKFGFEKRKKENKKKIKDTHKFLNQKVGVLLSLLSASFYLFYLLCTQKSAIFERVSVPGSLDCPDHNQLSGNCWEK